MNQWQKKSKRSKLNTALFMHTSTEKSNIDLVYWFFSNNDQENLIEVVKFSHK